MEARCKSVGEIVFFSLTTTKRNGNVNKTQIVEICARGLHDKNQQFRCFVMPTKPIDTDISLKTELFVKFFHDKRRPRFMDGCKEVKTVSGRAAIQLFLNYLYHRHGTGVILATYSLRNVQVLVNASRRLGVKLDPNVIGGFVEIKRVVLTKNPDLPDTSLAKLLEHLNRRRSALKKTNASFEVAQLMAIMRKVLPIESITDVSLNRYVITLKNL